MTLGITGNTDKQYVLSLLPDVLQWLIRHNVDFVVDERITRHLSGVARHTRSSKLNSLCHDCDMVLTFGGDGTILSTVREIGRHSIPILGVKIGGMGFLADLNPDELFASLENILQGDYRIVERMVLRADISNSGETETYFALNDFVLDKGAIPRVVRIKTYIDDEFLNNYIGDGLIISSPTGSTAYSLAAGGPILPPTMQAIIINPISPHSLAARPVVVPADKSISVQVEFTPESVWLSGDGQIGRELKQNERITFRKADHVVKLVTFHDRSFYDVLRAKLHWGEDIRGK